MQLLEAMDALSYHNALDSKDRRNADVVLLQQVHIKRLNDLAHRNDKEMDQYKKEAQRAWGEVERLSGQVQQNKLDELIGQVWKLLEVTGSYDKLEELIGQVMAVC